MPFLTPDAPTETAVIVPIPAAEPLVGHHRRRLDASAALGVPAHVTVLGPFIKPTEIDQNVLARLAAAVQSVGPFSCSFDRTRWFGEEVLWLEPVPAEPFRRLTIAVWDAFPDCPPYGGAYDAIVPHLTIADRAADRLVEVQAVETAVSSGLPVAASVDHVLLMGGSAAADSWRVLFDIPLTRGALD
jgi:2'-5' RNA ligase